MRHGRKYFTCLWASVLALALSGCPIQPTEDADNPETEPRIEFSNSEEDILEARGKYRVSLIGLEVIEDGSEAGAMAGDAEARTGTEGAGIEAAAMAAEEEGEGEEELNSEADLSEGPRSVEVMMDLIVRFLGPGDPLPGITVDVTHSDPYGQEKGRFPTWVETPEFRRGEKRQVPVSLEVPNYESGDEFYLEFSEFVPPEERGDYREFSQAAP